MKRTAAAIFIVCAALVHINAVELYVSPDGDDANPGTKDQPFLTLEKARDYLRSIGPAGNTVILRGGDYFRENTLSLDDRDGGAEQQPVVWKGMPGEDVRVFGGVPVTGWEIWKGNIYRARLELPDHVVLDTMVWTLSENGFYSPPARHPNLFTGEKHGFWKTISDQPGVLHYSETDFPADWSDDYHCRGTAGVIGWFSHTWPVREVDFTSRIIMTDPACTDGAQGVWRWEGSREFIDLPGEWAIAEDGYVYYYPKKTPIDDQLIVAGTILRIIEIVGTDQNSPAAHITIDGITFSTSDCTWRGLSNKQNPAALNNHGFTANYDEDYSRHAMIVAENAEHITIQNCRFLAVGLNGIQLNYRCQYATVRNNWIEDVNYNAISAQSYPPDVYPLYINKGHTIENNFIWKTGHLFSNGVGIYLANSGECTIQHNEVRNAPRYGITMKGYFETDYVYTQYNKVQYNDVSHVIHSTWDCGAIESWNIRNGNSFYHNLVHDVYHPAINARAYNYQQDPVAITDPPGWGWGPGLSNRWGIYIDGERGDNYDSTHCDLNIIYNMIDGVRQRRDNGQVVWAVCRSAARKRAEAIGFDWSNVGLRNNFPWYGQTPATDGLEEEFEFPEEIIHDQDYREEYFRRYNTGTGLLGTYYSDDNFSTRVREQVDSVLIFEWIDGSPTGTGTWSVRWEGYVVPVATEMHRFCAVADPDLSCVVTVDGEVALDDDSHREKGDMIRLGMLTDTLEAQKYVPITVEAKSTEPNSYFKLEWYSMTAIPSMPVLPWQLYPAGHDTSKPPEFRSGGASAVRNTIPEASCKGPSLEFAKTGTCLTVGSARERISSVKLLRVDGKLFASWDGNPVQRKILDISAFSSGMYIMKVKTAGHDIITRILLPQ
ncbi:MAG: hypothetical protein GF350_15355 [Chitinivibrionales bacterium]|nr:hypothetical protein [Chitinivibrionales bacterium]